MRQIDLNRYLRNIKLESILKQIIESNVLLVNFRIINYVSIGYSVVYIIMLERRSLIVKEYTIAN